MPRNIELKARVAALDAARGTAQSLATAALGSMRQIDTYFRVPHGRLKLRQIDDRASQLIAYQRRDATEARASDYQIVPIADGELLKQALANTLGVQVVIDKTRELFLYRNVRIHLDQVHELGTFVEFEAVLDESTDDAKGHEQVAWLCRQFAISAADIVAESYSDLKLARKGRP
jgi:predicted adenylyl cyclase CyaB